MLILMVNQRLSGIIVSRSVKYCALLFFSMLLLCLPLYSQQTLVDVSFDGATGYNGDRLIKISSF